MGVVNLLKKREKEKYSPTFKPNGNERRWYQHDIDTIVYSSFFRKMQRKAQLFSIQDPIFRSRIIHTFEVVRISKEISERLKLNTELTEAIALAHDFGNVAYGKVADKFLQDKTKGAFKHEEVSSLMLKLCSSRTIPDSYRDEAKQIICRDYTKTHLLTIDAFPYKLEVYKFGARSIHYTCMSPEVIEGVKKHGTENVSHTLEGQVVNYADNIAYLIQDISDFEEVGIFDRETKARYEKILDSLVENCNEDTTYIKEIVSATTSSRTSALIERFVLHNLKVLEKWNRNNPGSIFSEIVGRKIPILEMDPILKKAIDACWEFKKDFYEEKLINISNSTSKTKMNQLWDIIDKDSPFVERNKAYSDFMKMLDSPIFNSYREEKKITENKDWENWKKAFFIANLTCDEIDLIIKSYLERDYIFDLSLPKMK